MIEIRHFKLLDIVSKVGSLKKAADLLCLTQSALSHQLKELESVLGTPVFHRANNRLHFTPVGKELLDTGREILEKLHLMESKVQQIAQDQLKKYIHGYSREETKRLNDQATSIAELLHWDSRWEPGSLILEAGCGVGAQTSIIARQNPDSRFISVDLSEKSLAIAAQVITEQSITNVEFRQADVLDLPFPDDSFDHVFVCFLLEHLTQPDRALHELKRVLKKDGSITIIEGDHGSTYFFPESLAANKVVQAQVTLQKQNGGNPNIGRQLYTLLSQVGFCAIDVNPRQVYVDESKPELHEGFTKNTFTAMIKGIAAEAISKKVIASDVMEEGIQDLNRVAEAGGSFCYTFFKAQGIKECSNQ